MLTMSTTLKRCAALLAILIVIVVSRAASSAQAATAGLRMQGVTLVNNDGSRFIVAGINMEMYRDYANGCGYVTDDSYTMRSTMADRLKGLGVNAVRLNYAYRYLNQSGNLSRFLDMAQELTNRGIYVMPSDHTYTGGVLSGASASYPTMKQIVDGMRSRGLENYLIMNPYNEPGPDISTSQWVQAQKDVLTYLRNTAGFQGVVMMDGTGWATLLDVNAFQQVMNFDASLRGGTANVGFSMHLYPNIPSLPNQLWSAAKQVPLIVGELGQENPGASALDPNYVKTVISGALNTGIPNGHNGLFAWIWAWCDSNGMVQESGSGGSAYSASLPLTSHGTLWQTNYYSKLPTQSVPVPTVIAQQPTATRTNTPRPATATRTSVAPTVTRTNTPRPATATRTGVAPTATRTNTPRPVTATATSAATDRTFYRAINLGGGALTLNGKAWEASASAPNLTIGSGASSACNTYVNLSPTTDATTKQMIQCSVEHWSHAITLSQVPNAAYDVYLYTWQDWNDPNPGKASFSLNGAVMQANYALSKQAGHWEKLGPWRVSVTNGNLKLTSSGDTIKLSGLEVWRVGAGSSSVVMEPTSESASRAAAPANPIGFYRGFNLNGQPVVIDGNAWEGDSADVNVSGTTGCNTAAVFSPIADMPTSDMLRCYVTGNNLKVVVSNIPAGTYDVYAYLWDMPQQYTLTLQGGQVSWFNQPNPNMASWQKVGPWSVTVDVSGTLQLETAGVANLAGIALWRTSASDTAISLPPVAPTFVPDQPRQSAATTAVSQPLTQVIESDDTRLIHQGDWQAQSTGNVSGGSYLFSSTGRLSFAFTGTQFDVLYVQHPALGSFVIEVDGVVLQLVNSHSDQTAFKVIASVRNLAAGQHAVTIYPTDGVAAIDAVVLEANATLN